MASIAGKRVPLDFIVALCLNGTVVERRIMMSDEPDYYGGFINVLEGMIEQARMEGYDADGIAHLEEASEFFSSDYRILQNIRKENEQK
jgi:hypothetical protein